MLSKSENGRIKCMITSDNKEELKYKKVSEIYVSKIIVDDSQGLKMLDNINIVNNDSQTQNNYRH